MSQVVVIASHKIDEKFSDEFAKRLNFHVRNCVAIEPGCLHFSVSHDSETGLWHYVEIYGSKKDFDTHCNSEHFLTHMGGVKHMIVGDVDVTTAEVREYASK